MNRQSDDGKRGVEELVEISAADAAHLESIGRFRLDVWRGETVVDEALFPSGVWLEPEDRIARHWIVRDDQGLVAAARLTVHDEIRENPDGYLWLRAGLPLPTPVAHYCKLVVAPRGRGRGLGRRLNQVRLEAARAMGAKAIIVTASAANARLLLALGFTDTGIRETFANRPGFTFWALQRLL